MNQTYVIATSTKVDISGVNVEKFDDAYFARDKKQKAKKNEGELFESEKEVCFYAVWNFFSFVMQPCIVLLRRDLSVSFRRPRTCRSSRRTTRRLWMLS